jgi:hypothetical protein
VAPECYSCSNGLYLRSKLIYACSAPGDLVQLTANCVQVNGNTRTYMNCQFTVLEGDFR